MPPASLINLISVQGRHSQCLALSLLTSLTEHWSRDKHSVFRDFFCDWKEGQGSPSKNIPMVHLPPPVLIPARNFPTYSRAAHTERDETEKAPQWNTGFCFFVFLQQLYRAVIKIYFHFIITERLLESSENQDQQLDFMSKKQSTYELGVPNQESTNKPQSLLFLKDLLLEKDMSHLHYFSYYTL